jgi:hypothetical protein
MTPKQQRTLAAVRAELALRFTPEESWRGAAPSALRRPPVPPENGGVG